MILGIKPTVDYAFKYFLGREPTKPILINVIDSVLDPAPDGRIDGLDLLNPFNPKASMDDKLSILDIKARDHAGRQFNVEMQVLATASYKKRILYYSCKFHPQQLPQGADYAELKPTISISFIDDVLFPDVDGYHHHFQLLEKTHHFPLTGDVEFHILELPKFMKTAGELRSDLDVWLYFLRNAEKMDTEALPLALQSQPLVVRAVEELKVLTQDDLERERYEARLKAQMDHISFMNELKRMREQVEDLQQGLRQGRAEGEIIGAIHAYEQLLNRPQTPVDKLTGLAMENLASLAEQLRIEVVNRN